MKIVVPVKQVAALDDEFELLDDGAGGRSRRPRVGAQRVGHVLARGRARSCARPRASGEVVAVTRRRRGGRGGAAQLPGEGRRPRRADLGRRRSTGADALAVARVLAAAVERESPDLVLCGVQSSDAVNGATGIALAGHLDLPHVAVVKADRARPARRRPSSASSRAASSRCCGRARPRC